VDKSGSSIIKHRIHSYPSMYKPFRLNSYKKN